MKYEDLKARFNLIGELLRLRRRDGARAHQGKINDARANC